MEIIYDSFSDLKKYLHGGIINELKKYFTEDDKNINHKKKFDILKDKFLDK